MAERAAKQLELNKSELPNSITEVIATLSRAGFDAYIVGGGVRDTLLGLKPKDFDAVTDAKPHEIKDVFGKRCRIIGRRFQLAHVYSGRELIEVATFRGPPINDSNTNQDGMILRDNVWGDIQQDFARRDFSINALYYQPLKGVVHDFCGALNDIDNKIIRLLGDAPVRIEEDPVRLLRALRFKAKLGFEFDDELAAQFHRGNWALLEQISPHRLYDETQKMFTGGYLVPLLPLLFESGAIDSLIIYPPSEPNALVQQVAINTDKRINAGKSINPAFFYAALLWENYLHQLEKAKKRNMPFAEAQLHAAGKVIDRQRIKTAIPKFAEQFIRDIWLLQPKLAAPRSKQIEQLAEHPRFRAGFDFLLLREQCGDAEHPLSESTNGMGDWWQTYQTLSEREQQQAIEDFDENLRRGAYKRGRGRNRQPSAAHTNSQPVNKPSNTDNSSRDQHSAKPDVLQQTGNAQTTVNDASNIPSRRRRAAQKSEQPDVTTAKVPNGRVQKSSQQLKQDSHELSQLQQLSLASSTGISKKYATSKPAPLFVIEHGNVVPPLQKQLTTEQIAQSATSKAAVQKVAQERVPTKQTAQVQDNKAAEQVDSSNKKHAVTTNAPKMQQPSDAQQSSDPNVSAVKPDAARSIAQTPQMVTINNEPIPYKRRRRQPSIELKNVTPKSLELQTPSKAEASLATTQYEKKAPKPAQSSPARPKTKTTAKVDKNVASVKPTKAAISTATDQVDTVGKAKKANVKNDVKNLANTNNVASPYQEATNKGPVPAKRRRRQPSTDNA
ncbi:polynucleotide adenylyltransferase PcnB [Psychrobacter urativorans]|uniref:Poly(A) polymerase I n=1 Tax=Psychrobacter urativorans TaxID=45610 RepID=A0A0M4U4X1_9GAMM|nr:polynucleotide adenylyltransferase PcnB [Psychrobacter urativorans]ALF59819.1 poly(A) polymerase [Psychrobacter urativorans]